jgi:hypothetical protein
VQSVKVESNPAKQSLEYSQDKANHYLANSSPEKYFLSVSKIDTGLVNLTHLRKFLCASIAKHCCTCGTYFFLRNRFKRSKNNYEKLEVRLFEAVCVRTNRENKNLFLIHRTFLEVARIYRKCLLGVSLHVRGVHKQPSWLCIGWRTN